MSKGIMNRRDKMIWDNSALPTIDDVTGQISDLAESVAEDLQDAYEELDDKIDQAVTDCTYTAGTGISIDEDNVISASGSINYSTTERVVGTWIDDKPIYEQTITFTGVARGRYQINHNIANINFVVGYEYIFDQDPVGNGWFRSLPESVSDLYAVFVSGVSATQIDYRYGTSWSIDPDLYITIRYTKTTD